ncbi:phosphomethylpyrimidine synthase ThiC [Magnetospirillum sulfuroxidans]|uniref:Phosphomethylpyrimidine synthase ThiC n=1 Tax=Magnetospirillum sulfuroxidans TaxID=611300 RepID=A0ABS5ICG0_9PROT|nr:phosphomethylpyrimidine synthase ThiC [Magnetospirillum sulfuroxidans]MBR9972112.1 phosphomethylpyrimidine synthase ThiC [Magnetospirillum sulfuroxidans]
MEIDEIILGLDDVLRGNITADLLRNAVEDGSAVLIRGRERSVAVGSSLPVKINTNIGISDKSDPNVEVEKLKLLSSFSFRPDLMMDHTIDREHRDFWKTMVRHFDGPVGTLPHYTIYSPQHGIEKSALIDRITEMLEGGVAFMTLHFTSDPDIYDVARKTRPIPVTSRGGGLVVRDMLRSGRNENVFRAAIADIASVFRKFDATISVGTTYRPPDIFSALDEAHTLETKRQVQIVRELREAGVSVIMEGVGHVQLTDIPRYIAIASKAKCPFMPLGPTTTDSAIGFDHVVNAIGGVTMALAGGAHILNSITREEHTGGVPSLESVVEGLKAAKVAAHSVNVTRFERIKAFDRMTIEQRGKQVSCVVAGGLFNERVDDPRKGCNRCSFECPIVLAPASPIH